MANIPLPLYQRYYMSCNSDTASPPPLMAAPTLHRRHCSFSSYSFSSPYNSQFLKPHLLKPRKTLPKPPSPSPPPPFSEFTSRTTARFPGTLPPRMLEKKKQTGSAWKKQEKPSESIWNELEFREKTLPTFPPTVPTI
ncbi:UNVERIFIED_CONTAM: hypothetical protein Sangu_0546500 [Sesamum angustifolium]|uniref:Uncharacterized protein n=1 Tax=Sesamum angustifolium TaxID=2727405 RepID=A0AAW2Q9M2_9LAMI